MGRRAAVVAGAVLTFAGTASANVLIQNRQAVDFSVSGPPCMIKVAGEDVASFPDGFAFDPTPVVDENGVDVTREAITIRGVEGDIVTADEVQVIENNCTVPLDIRITDTLATGDWTGKHLQVWLGTTTNAGAYPVATPDPNATQWDQTPIVIDSTGAVVNGTTGTITVPAGASLPVGMIVTTGAPGSGADAASGSATWTVAAETS